MDHQQKSPARLAPVQGFKSIASFNSEYTTTGLVYEFLNEMQSLFGPLPVTPIGDGQIHRFHIPGDRMGSRNGWYVLYADGVPSGAFGSWKTGASFNWSAKGDFDQVEREAFRRRLEEAQRQRTKTQEERQTSAAAHALTLWKRAQPASNGHPYLIAKAMPHFNLRQLGNVLLVPLVDINLNLMNLQRITPNGAKRFLPNGRISGCFSLLGRVEHVGMLFVCEGWATGATIHQVTGHPVACAMNCGNLKKVAAAFREKFPCLTITLAGDDDRNTEGNPGRTKAIEAAAHARALVTFPEFCRPDCGCTDFNDAYLCRIGGGAQ